MTDPAHGTVTVSANGAISYVPTTGYSGPDSFTYKANDGALDSNTVTVSLTVTPTNAAPVAVADSYSTPKNTTLAVAAPGVLANDTDADSGDTLTAAKVTDPAHGTVTVSANGAISYVPTTGYIGSDSFTYRANDGALDSNTVTVSLTVTGPTQGYWMVASDGGIFTFGTAGFFGSKGGQPLDKPIVGMTRTPSGLGLLAGRLRRRHLRLRQRPLLRLQGRPAAGQADRGHDPDPVRSRLLAGGQRRRHLRLR